MKIRRLRTAAGMLSWIMALFLSGCHTGQQPTAEDNKAAAESADVSDEVRGVAEATLGKGAEIVAKGNLAQNGREQVLVVNRFSTGAQANMGEANPLPIIVTRAAILEKNEGKWSEILLCDEHLKNPNGYLGGIPEVRVSGWRLELRQDTKEGLEMKFTPTVKLNADSGNAGQSFGQRLP